MVIYMVIYMVHSAVPARRLLPLLSPPFIPSPPQLKPCPNDYARLQREERIERKRREKREAAERRAHGARSIRASERERERERER